MLTRKCLLSGNADLFYGRSKGNVFQMTSDIVRCNFIPKQKQVVAFVVECAAMTVIDKHI